MSKAIAVLWLTLAPAVAAGAFEISTCGQTVGSDQTGVLAVDLGCDSGPAVLLSPRGRLDLDGRTIAVQGDGPAVYCGGGGCAVFSSSGRPAAIVAGGAGASSFGVLADADPNDPELCRLVVQNVDIAGGTSGIHAPESTLAVAAVTVAGTRETGIVAQELDAFNLTVTSNGEDGVRAESVHLVNASVSGNGRVDVVSAQAPALGDHVTCGSSAGAPGSRSWSACSLDQ